YPFGLNHTGGSGLNNSLFGSFNSYKYNGKELQETGMFDYGWRQYVPDLGRWNGMDQLAESYLSTSPYAYVLNNPISFLDPDGRNVKPTSGGYEFTGNDLQNVMSYLQNNGSPQKLMSALSAWEGENSGGDFWGYLGSWNSWGATGEDVGGSLYASRWGDGEMGATANDIQEIVFTKTKIADVQSEWFKEQQLETAWLQPGRAQMIGSVGDFLGIFDIAGQVMSTWKPQSRYLAMTAGIIGAVALRKPKLATSEIQAEKGLVEDFIKVRHHTSTSAVKAIKKSGSINVSSPRPFGVDVEIEPFIRPSKVSLGQAAGGNLGGGYIEFTVPKWGVTPTPYIGGTGNSGRIIVEGRMQLNISTLNPKYVKRWWWPF
ncbi:RHS repeat-associated core domain-containing protein, partial [Chryseobacterium arthrosphaerae]|uniref:RHS repeat-associated core domain-containing protein n=2 Tax=Chryseobacterium arthrosphaerae TaxID=651561 RepID=UPI002414F42E